MSSVAGQSEAHCKYKKLALLYKAQRKSHILLQHDFTALRTHTRHHAELLVNFVI